MKYLGYSVNSGLKNMQIDENLLDTSIETSSSDIVFRLYGWQPACVSLGRNQKEKDSLKDYCSKNKIDIVRRLTGGRALFHCDEITYAIVASISRIPDGESVIKSYKYISNYFIEFFKSLNIELDYGNSKKSSSNQDYCMLLATGADICYNNAKIIGSAQCRKKGYILQHGSILYSYDKEILNNLFSENIDNITSLKDIIPNISKEDFIKKLEVFLQSR